MAIWTISVAHHCGIDFCNTAPHFAHFAVIAYLLTIFSLLYISQILSMIFSFVEILCLHFPHLSIFNRLCHDVDRPSLGFSAAIAATRLCKKNTLWNCFQKVFSRNLSLLLTAESRDIPYHLWIQRFHRWDLSSDLFNTVHRCSSPIKNSFLTSFPGHFVFDQCLLTPYSSMQKL